MFMLSCLCSLQILFVCQSVLSFIAFFFSFLFFNIESNLLETFWLEYININSFLAYKLSDHSVTTQVFSSPHFTSACLGIWAIKQLAAHRLAAELGALLAGRLHVKNPSRVIH